MSNPAAAAPPDPTASGPSKKVKANKPLLVWNQKRGVRQVTASTPAGTDPGGMVRHQLVQVQCFPGLNLVPPEHVDLAEEGLEATDGLSILRNGLERDLPTQTAKLAIEQTGIIEVLTTLAAEVKDTKLRDAIASQIAKLAKEGPSGSRARDLQIAHSRRV